MSPPRIKDAPGHIWRKHSKGFECRWQCRTDLVERGFLPKSQQLFVGKSRTKPRSPSSRISAALQDEMLTFGAAGLPVINAFTGRLGR
jgi:hypothetical protein